MAQALLRAVVKSMDTMPSGAVVVAVGFFIVAVVVEVFMRLALVREFSVFLIVPVMFSLVSCGSTSVHRDLNPKQTSPDKSVNQTSDVAPRYLIARVATRDLDLEDRTAADFVTVSGDVKIRSGEDAARAFASGRPAPKDREQALSLTSEQEVKFDLGMPAQVPVQMGAPCDPCAQSKGQIYTTSTGMTRGFFARVGSFLRRLNPLAHLGRRAIPYTYSNQYSYGGNSYVVYGQQPMPFSPVQYQYQQPGNQQPVDSGANQPPSRLHQD